MNYIFSVRLFPLLKNGNNEKHIKLFLGTNSCQDTLLLPGKALTKAHMNRRHVLTVFNSPGGTRHEKNRKYQTNSAQVSYKLSRNCLLAHHRNISSQWLNLCQPNAWSQCDNVDVCPSGDVGSGHVLPSKIEQDETKGY